MIFKVMSEFVEGLEKLAKIRTLCYHIRLGAREAIESLL